LRGGGGASSPPCAAGVAWRRSRTSTLRSLAIASRLPVGSQTMLCSCAGLSWLFHASTAPWQSTSCWSLFARLASCPFQPAVTNIH